MTGLIGDGNTFYVGEGVVLADAGARTTSGNGPAIGTGTAHTLRATLTVSAVAGTTPSATVTLQTSADGTSWRTLATYSAATGAGSQRLSASGLDRLVRASWTITGTTPSVTFAVSGEFV